MRIAFYTNAYHPTISGVVTSVSSYRRALSDLGHNVFVFTANVENYVDQEPFIFRYPSIDIPQFPDLPLVIPISSSFEHILPSLKLDVIHSHHPVLLGRTAAREAEKLNLPLVFTFHTRYREYSHYISLNQKFVKDQIDNWLCDYLGKVHHIVVPSESMRRILESEYGFYQQVTTIPTGIDFSLFDRSKRGSLREKLGWGTDIVLISVGRLEIEKNWEVLIKAAAQVILKHSDVRLVILGDGSEYKNLVKLAKELGVAAKVEFPGKIETEVVPNYLVAADVFCFASITETQGLATVEAMAAGLPIAAVDASGTSDAFEDGKQGFLTPNDSAALADGIEKLVSEKDFRNNMGKSARLKARDFDINFQARKLISVYEIAIESARAGDYVKCKR
ncbi:MAG: glycosyltransferase [Chloroflexota bacterium]